MYMRFYDHNYGQNVAEFALIGAVLGVVGLGSLVTLEKIFNNSLPGLMASISGSSATSAPLANGY